jgi:hypothetical protein
MVSDNIKFSMQESAGERGGRVQGEGGDPEGRGKGAASVDILALPCSKVSGCGIRTVSFQAA